MEGCRLLRGITLSAVFALVGCTTWSHSSIKDPEVQERQRAIDNAYCKRVAVGAAPMPSVSVLPIQGANGTWIHGQSTTYGTNGEISRSAYSGSAVPTGSFGSGLASGMAQGAAVGALMLARQQQDEIHAGCMMELGWTKGSGTKKLVATPSSFVQFAGRREVSGGRWQSVGSSGDGGQLFITPAHAQPKGVDITVWVRVLLPRPAGLGEGAMADEWREMNTFHCGQRRRTLHAYVVLYNNSPLFPVDHKSDGSSPEDIPASSLMAQFYKAACSS